jgi:hypothetical protein
MLWDKINWYNDNMYKIVLVGSGEFTSSMYEVDKFLISQFQKKIKISCHHVVFLIAFSCCVWVEMEKSRETGDWGYLPEKVVMAATDFSCSSTLLRVGELVSDLWPGVWISGGWCFQGLSGPKPRCRRRATRRPQWNKLGPKLGDWLDQE